MCKYCEEKDNQDYYYISFIAKDDHYIAYDKQDKKFKLFDYYDEYCSTIQYCPWCGRKLEVLEGKPEPAPSQDDFDLLSAQVQKIEARLDRVCTNLYCVVEKRWWDEDNN